MNRRLLSTLAALFFIALFIQSDSIVRRVASGQARSLPAPEDVLGFRPGDDRKLASWAKIVEYFQKLDTASDRVRFEEIGKTTMGAPFVFATISAPENLQHLDEYKRIQDQLADPRTLGSPRNEKLADSKAHQLIARGKTIVAITCGIHSTEVGSTLSSMLIAHRLASSNEPEIQEILRHTIILLVPSTNPDGVDIVKNWYDKTLGTPYEGTSPPELYHKYTGHDNNRDWYAFTQVETQLVVDKIFNVWHPQIVHDIHQQGDTGSRLFLPPYMDPIEPNVPKQIVEGYTELGNYVAQEMRASGFKGITTNSTYDAWTPARAYSHYHAGVRILSETASAKIATPITVKFEQLNSREGFDPKKESWNFGPVWQGGEWHLRDITNYMTGAAFFLMQHAAQNRDRWLKRFYEIGKEAVRPRNKGELWGLVMPGAPYTRGFPPENLVRNKLVRGGVEVIQTKNGFLIRMDQPYAGFARALLENRKYPDLRNAKGEPIPPYDVTAHNLALLYGAEVRPLYSPIKYQKVESVWLGTLLGCTRGLGDVAIYKSHVPAMDEGWTRWLWKDVFDPPRYPEGTVVDLAAVSRDCGRRSSLEDDEARAGKLFPKYSTIVIPDQSPNVILNGHRKGAMPEDLTGGLGEKGVQALREFVEQGGTLVCLNRASDFAIKQFQLPVRDVTDGLPQTEFFAPGSILRIELDTDNRIARGMPKESIAWVENSPVFEMIDAKRGTSPTVREGSNADGTSALPAVKIIAWYPRDKIHCSLVGCLGAIASKAKPHSSKLLTAKAASSSLASDPNIAPIDGHLSLFLIRSAVVRSQYHLRKRMG